MNKALTCKFSKALRFISSLRSFIIIVASLIIITKSNYYTFDFSILCLYMSILDVCTDVFFTENELKDAILMLYVIIGCNLRVKMRIVILSSLL